MNEPGNKACSVTEVLPDQAAADAMAVKRRELIRQPLERIWLDLARAAIAAMPGWQPIETAPKDGTEWLLIYDSIHCLTVTARYHDDASAFEGPYGRFVWEMQEDAGTLAERSVTHWMPLPAPPEVQS